MYLNHSCSSTNDIYMEAFDGHSPKLQNRLIVQKILLPHLYSVAADTNDNMELANYNLPETIFLHILH